MPLQICISHILHVSKRYILNVASGEKGKFARCPVLSVTQGTVQIFQERQIISFIKGYLYQSDISCPVSLFKFTSLLKLRQDNIW